MASYYVYSGAGGSNNGSSWTNAFTTLTTAFATEIAGDTLYVAHDHAESTAGAVTLTSSGTPNNLTKVICVNRSGSVPPVSADRRTTAAVSTSAANSMILAGSAHYDGIIFTAGVGTASAINLTVGNTASSYLRLDNCSLRIASTNATVQGIILGSSTVAGILIELNNTTMSHGHVSNVVAFAQTVKWRNTPSALIGTIPTYLLLPPTSRGGLIECIGIDFSAAGSGKTIIDTNTAQGSSCRFVDCKLNASVTRATTPGTAGAPIVDFIRTGATGVNYTVSSYRYTGTLTEEITIVRSSGGASDGTTPISWKIITTSTTSYSLPFECPPVAIWNDTTGSAKTATIECIAAAIMTDQEIWVELEYLGDASSPLASFVADSKADLLATGVNQTTSSETWGGSTTAFKLGVTFTPQQKGWVYARVKCAKASSTFYVDPLITLS